MKNVKRILIVLVCFLLICQVPLARAAEAEGQTGTFTWSLTDGVLTIDGEGDMPDYTDGAPWDAYKEQITKVVLTGGVTRVGDCAFKDYDQIKDVDFGDAIYELGKQSFYNCDGLTVLYFPQSFKVFGEESLRHCTGLKEIHSEGRFPSFRLNCLWDTKVIIYYPEDRPWGLQYIQELEDAFNGRIEFHCEDGTDPYDPEATTAPPETDPPVTTEPPATQAPAQATVPDPTVPAATLPAPTLPPETQPPVTQPQQTEPSEPVKEEEDSGVKWIWLVIAVFFALLAMTIPSFVRPKRRKKQRRRTYDYE